jgi:spermidine synthase/Tfp pilus assembly protein PilF
MIIELVASRLIARHLGSSLYTWTAVIGVVLAGITIGNYIGGRLADSFRPQKTIATLFIISSASCVITVILNNIVGEWTFLWNLNWPVRVFVHVGLVFLLPSIILGTISPLVAKMALEKELPQGRTVGDIYAFGAAGSIAGTFIAGYYLIAVMGTINIIWSVAIILATMAIFYWAKSWIPYIYAAALVIILLIVFLPSGLAKNVGTSVGLRTITDPAVIYEDETPYCYVAVRQISRNPDVREFIQDKLTHSQIVMNNIDSLEYFYTKIFAGLTHELSKNKETINSLVIGGGGYAFPRYLKKHWPESRVDVVEIDPGVTKAAIEAFGLAPDSSINTINMDARNYIDDLIEQKYKKIKTPSYDFIYEDAINDYSVPFQLVTKEFNDKIYPILSDDGIYMINLIDTYNNAQFLGAIVNTIEKTFPNVYVLTNLVSLPSLRETYVVVAAKQPIDIKKMFGQYDKSLKVRYFGPSDYDYLKKKADGIVLTDDYAPVENLLSPVVRQSGKEILARKFLQRAEQLKVAREYDKSIEKYEQAAELNPSMTVMAYNEIGMIYNEKGEFQKAAEALKKAIDCHYNVDAAQNIIGSVHLNFGILLGRMQQNAESRVQLNKAAEQFKIETQENPNSVATWSRYGNTLAMLGEFEPAAKAFKKCIDLERGNPEHYDNLAKTLEYQGKYEEAIQVTQQQIQVLKSYNSLKEINLCEQYVHYLEKKLLEN